MTDSDPLDLDLLRAYARAALERTRLIGGDTAVAILAASVLTLCAEQKRVTVLLAEARKFILDAREIIENGGIGRDKLRAERDAVKAELEQARAENANLSIDDGNMLEDISRVKHQLIEALQTDGEHHKQWYLEQILGLLGCDPNKLSTEMEAEGGYFERGIAP